MKKIILIIILLAIFGCAKDENEVIKIGDIGVSLEEFDLAFATSGLASGGEAKRREFLDTFISRKLMLLEAEKMGLDKDPQFLQNIQLFWEQSLLKLVLQRKMNELSSTIKIDDKEVRDFYKQIKGEDASDEEFTKMYDQIKLILFKEKQNKAIQVWVNSLRRETEIEIDYDSLGIKQ